MRLFWRMSWVFEMVHTLATQHQNHALAMLAAKNERAKLSTCLINNEIKLR